MHWRTSTRRTPDGWRVSKRSSTYTYSDTPSSSPAPVPSPSQSAPAHPGGSPGTTGKSSSTRVWRLLHPPVPARTGTNGTVPASPREWSSRRPAGNGTAGDVEPSAEADAWCDRCSAAQTRPPSSPDISRYAPDRPPSSRRSLAARSSWCSRAGIRTAPLSPITWHAQMIVFFPR